VVVSMGGQTPNNLAIKLHRAGIKVLGTSPESIDRAESRDKFSALLDALGIDQPRWAEAKELDDLNRVVKSLGGYPVLVRPSYVLSGAAMRVVHSADKLRHYIEGATRLSPEHPVVISKFETDALEIELDAVAREGEVILWAVSEHIERAGVHSGDATLVFPAQDLSAAIQLRVRDIGEKLARALQITGPFNLQMLVKGDKLKVIECNLRASRSFPFVSKVLGINFIREATRVMLGVEPARESNLSQFDLNYVAVKAPQFSFDRLKGAEPKLGVEMASTGEVLDVLHQIDGTPSEFQFLTGRQAQNNRTFRLLFERETGQKFTPNNFRRARLELMDQADAIIVIRTGLSESTAFEIAYNIFGGPRVPIFFAIWDRAPIKTTLLRDLNAIVPVRYVTFSDPEELTEPLLDFFGTCVKVKSKERRTHSRQIFARVK
jgi:carbamoylphosphate synthase large subunit